VLRDFGQAVRGMETLLEDASGAPGAVAHRPMTPWHHDQEGAACSGWRTRSGGSSQLDRGEAVVGVPPPGITDHGLF
jgi:hypothetical protein